MAESPHIVFISWAAPVPRSDNIAAALGGYNHTIVSWKRAPVWLAPLRYAVQSWRTWITLRREQPDAVIAMNPPIALPLVVWCYSLFHNAVFLIDSHTGAFLSGWRHTLFLHRFLSRRALTTLVTNDPLANWVRRWGARAMVLEDRLPDLPVAPPSKPNARFTITVINSYAWDEPLNELIAAAQSLNQCNFHITGRVPVPPPPVLSDLPGHIRLTGFLATEDYISLLNRSDALMALVTQDHTLLCGAYEAVAVEKPLIISDWPALRGYFNKGAVYVDNSVESIRQAVEKVIQSSQTYKAEMRMLKGELERDWELKREELARLITARGEDA